MEELSMAEIGKRIRAKREELGLTQEELAARLGYKSKTTIAKIENGTNDIVQSKVVDFAKALNTSVAYLMGWEKEEQVADVLLKTYKSELILDEQLKRITEYYKLMNQSDRDMLENLAKRCAETKDD